MKKLRLTIVSLLALIVIIGGCLSYFFIWRPSDDGYKAAGEQLTTIRAISTNVNTAMAAVHKPTDIKDSSVISLAESANKFNAALKSLSETTAITKDQAVKNVYEQNKDSLTNYGQSVSDLAASMEKYRIILISCSGLIDKLGTITTAAAFDTAANGCNVAIENAKSAPDTSFKDQYLSKYTIQATDLLAAYRQQVTAGTNVAAKKTASDLVTSIKQKITNLGQEEFNITLNNPTENIQKLEDVVNSQKSAIFR